MSSMVAAQISCKSKVVLKHESLVIKKQMSKQKNDEILLHTSKGGSS